MKRLSAKQKTAVFAAVYCVSYITRINLSAVIQEVATATGYENSLLSTVPVCLSVTYGLGQIVNGRIGDIIKPQKLILIGLCTATAANLVFPFFGFSVPLMCVAWAVNGFAQAMIWPPIVKIMVTTMDEASYTSSVALVTMGSSVGTVLVYLASPLIISLLGWKSVLFLSAAVGLVAAVIWWLLKDRAYCESEIQEHSEGFSEKQRGFKMPKGAWFPLVFIALAIILQGMLRDGITSWVPTYLAENFAMGNETSILSTVSLAIFSVFAIWGARVFCKRFFKNEVSCAAVIFLISAVACGILLFFFGSGAAPAVVCMTLITGAMHGINLMLISYVPGRFKKYGNISTVSGVINSFTYIGAAIATYGIAKLSSLFGWKPVLALWLLISLAGAALLFAALPKWKNFIEK